MSTLHLEDVACATSDLNDLPLDAEVNIDDTEYARIMRRVTIGDAGTDTMGTSAFNSSI